MTPFHSVMYCPVMWGPLEDDFRTLDRSTNAETFQQLEDPFVTVHPSKKRLQVCYPGVSILDKAGLPYLEAAELQKGNSIHKKALSPAY
jgi:hypothetical protein